jgi:NAD(P)-dependent dehydrogenase (short-subunit alcohol dehydrogenase family)
MDRERDMTSATKKKKGVALVTGAGSGIGRSVALALAGDGFDVVLAGRHAATLDETASRAGSGAGRMVSAPADVTDPKAVAALFERIEYTFGRLDVLFNNAGVSAPAVPLDELPYEAWKTVVDVNLTGAFLCAQAAMRLMKRQRPKGGRIINNGSISAISPRPNSAPYTATKHALTGLTKSISLDGRADDIACSQIDIGNAATEFTEAMAAGILQANGTVMVEPRFDVGHVADAVVYMARLPLGANVQFMTLMATKMPLIGRG